MSLVTPSPLESLDAFYLEHRLRGELEGEVDEDHVWLACLTCDASIVKAV